jgi:hypothetical protein
MIIALLLTIVLPYSAVASIVDGPGCHHDAAAAHFDGATPMDHDHAAMVHADHAAQPPVRHDNCDCPMKCDCAAHCAGGGCNAALTLQPLEIVNAERAGQSNDHLVALIADPQSSPAFRPPIAALPGAA